MYRQNLERLKQVLPKPSFDFYEQMLSLSGNTDYKNDIGFPTWPMSSEPVSS
jgi:hypothetical protein